MKDLIFSMIFIGLMLAIPPKILLFIFGSLTYLLFY